MRILVIDDSEVMLVYIRESLKSIGIKKIRIVKNGKAALEILKSSTELNDHRFMYNLIICDWLMPDMSGLEVLKQIKSNKDMSDIPFIMLTSVKEREMVSEAIAAGVSSYILKPFTADTLYEKIEIINSKGK